MKLSFITAVFIAALTTAGVVPSNTSLQNLDSPLTNDTSLDWSLAVTVHTNAESSAFKKAVEIGRTLDAAMKSKDSVARWFFKDFPNFSETCQSPFDGDGREELKKWGFDDSETLRKEVEHECDFDEYHGIKSAFDELGLDTKAEKDGGPNKCFQIDHRNGPAIKRLPDGSLPGEANQYYEVCGKEYRATGATYEFAVNPNGMIALMNIMSLSYSAEKFTWFRKPRPDELPHIGTTSDIAWAVWNRAGAADIANVKYLLVTQIMNPGSRDMIREAIQTQYPTQSQTKVWPGHEFTMDTASGRAILGSPIGRWAGYFLLQHKQKLGGNRFISKVRAFRADKGSLPYLVFYIDPTPAASGSAADVPLALSAREDGATILTRSDSMDASRVVMKSDDGRSFVREHVIHGSSW